MIADDLTGALEVGAHFAQHGLRAAVVPPGRQAPGYDVLVVDSETRHLGESDAARAIRALGAPTALVYKKTDSTLRGNIAVELAALSELLEGARIAYLPAYPALGRTVRDGHLLVDGVPVHQTAFARDPLNPVRDSSVRALVRNLPCTVYDAESDAAIEAAIEAAFASGCRIFAGPASVAAALAARFGGPLRTPGWPRLPNCLVVNGSLHEVSAHQVEYARANGCLAGGWRQVAADGAIAAAARLRPEALMIFGGDTAFAIWNALGLPVLEPLGEAVPGVPVTRLADRPLHWITKAGGFGEESLICRLQRIFYA